MTQAAAGPNEDMEIGTRIIPEEPMAIVSLVSAHPLTSFLSHPTSPLIHAAHPAIPRPFVQLIALVCDSS
jgi:hypothetical protein